MSRRDLKLKSRSIQPSVTCSLKVMDSTSILTFTLQLSRIYDLHEYILSFPIVNQRNHPVKLDEVPDVSFLASTFTQPQHLVFFLFSILLESVAHFCSLVLPPPPQRKYHLHCLTF